MQATDKVDIAIFSAMKEELAEFEEKFKSCATYRVTINDFSFSVYIYQGVKVLLAHTGLGTTFAASALTLIHTHCHPQFALFTGTAGGINKDLKLRSVVLAEQAFEAEIQDAFVLLKNTPFESCLTHPFKNEAFYPAYHADKELLSIASSIANEHETPIFRGKVVSSNLFPAPVELFAKIKDQHALSIDMETSAFYQVAWLLKLPALAIRGISNILNTDGSDDHIAESDVTGSAKAAALFLEKLLNRLISLKFNKTLPISKQNSEVQTLVKKLNLEVHPEGGYFSAFYRAETSVSAADQYDGEMRSAGTSIYYLLNQEDFSAWHRLKSDELWHFYQGSSLTIHTIDKDGKLDSILLGNPLEDDQASFQACLKAGTWFAAEVNDKTQYCLVGCTVSPGFEYKDFELANKESLINQYPEYKEIITRLTRAKPVCEIQLSDDERKSHIKLA